MSQHERVDAAIVDYTLGNLFSVRQACERAGMRAIITSSAREILAADAVILPGVGAFGDAMAHLRRLELITVVREVAASGKVLVGVCLGMQLLMTESYEFGTHLGLGIIDGVVKRLEHPLGPGGRRLKVPQVGWNRIHRAVSHGEGQANPTQQDAWSGSPLEGLVDGEFMYFVHSFYAEPDDSAVVLSKTRYGHIEFCSTLARGNVFATQFHPERSGPQGLRIYRNVARLVTSGRSRARISGAVPV